MVNLLRPAPARSFAILSCHSDEIESRYRNLKLTAFCKRRSSWALLSPSRSFAADVVCCSGHCKPNLRLGLCNRMDFKVWSRSEIGQKQGRSLRVACASEGEGERQSSRLGSIIKNKQRILESQLRSMAEGELESRLALTKALTKPSGLLDTIAQQIFEGRTAVVVEVARLSPAETPEMLAERCVKYVEWGASALAVCTDEENSPNGLADLSAVCQAVTVPVLRRDWIIHPLQIADTCKAGASALTAVYSVLSKGLPAILNYAVSLGLDVVVEVINMKQLQEVATLGVPIYGVNLSVGLAISMPSVRQDISKSLIGEIPFGASSMVGVYSIEEARAVKYAGADALYIRHEVLEGPQAREKNSQVFLEGLREALSGDD